MASSSSSAAASNSNSAPPPESSPWELVTIGKGASRQLLEQFVVNNRGGLTCPGCGRMYLREELEKANRTSSSGSCGMLNGHLQSLQHKAGKANPAQAITSWFSTTSRQPHSSSTPRQETPAAPAAAGGGGARAGGPVIESVDEDDDSTMDEDNNAIATTYINNFTSLPQDAQRSIAQALTRKVQRCAGFRPQKLESRVDLLNHVPTAHLYASGSYHSTNLERLTGRVQLRQHNFHAVDCLEFAAPGGTKCLKCRAYGVKNLEECMPHLGKPASRLPTTLNDAHFSQYQMKQKKDSIREEERKKNLQLLTMRRKVHRQERALGLHERLLMVLTSGNARLMQATLVQAHKMGRSVAGMLEMATNCLQGFYRPRPRFTDVDMSVGMLVYTFGGTAAAHAANKALGMPCARLIRKVKEVVAFAPIVYTGISNYAQDVKKAAAANLSTSLLRPIKEEKMDFKGSFRGQWMMLLDGSALDKKVRYHPQTGTIIGSCEHVPVGIKLNLSTPADGAAVLAALKEGQENPDSLRAMHLAGEAVVVCLKPITGKGEDAPLLPVAVAPTCNRRSNLDHQQQLLTAVMAAYDDLRGPDGLPDLGEVVMVATDGDGKRRRALTLLCNVQQGKVPGKDLLLELILFDLYGGVLSVTVDYDWRHILKRIRVRIVFSNKGMQLSLYGPKLDTWRVQALFERHGVPCLASVFDNTDKQNVPAAVNLLVGMGIVADSFGDRRLTNEEADVRVLGALGDYLLKPMLGGVDDKGTKVSLEDALISYAAAAFLLFVIFSEMGANFIPHQLYHDMQSTIKNLYVVVARQLQDPKNDGVAHLLFFLLGTNELEKFFGTLRRMSPGMTFDLLQMLERIEAAARVEAIYAQHPDLDPGSRRLEGSTDKVNSASWRGNLTVDGDAAKLDSLWLQGMRLVLDLLAQHYYYGERVTFDGQDMTRAEGIIRKAQKEGFTMMRPNGRLVGVSVEAGGDLEKGQEDDAEDGLGGGAKQKEQEEEEAEWAANVRGPLEEMEEEERERMEQEQLEGGGTERNVFFDVQLEGGGTRKVTKSQWLKQQLGESNVATTRGSADRCARYQGQEKGGTAGSIRRTKLPVAELDEALVHLFDPVVFAVLINQEREPDKDRRQALVMGTVGVGVGEIVGLQNRGQGRGQQSYLREGLFQAEETLVQVRPIAVVATMAEEGGEEGVMELRRGHYTTRQAFSFKGGRFVSLLKPDMVMVEDGDRTEATWQISLDHLKERLGLLGDEVRVIAGGGRGKELEVPLDPTASVLEAGGVRMELFSEEETEIVSCEPCRRVNDRSEMRRADMRHHVAGHAFLSDLPVSICGFCGLDVGCTLVVKEDKLLSTCSLKLANFNYSKHEGARKKALQDRLGLETEVVVAAATSEALRRSKPKPTVQNIPVPCPVDACGKTIWKHNIIPHLLENDHTLPVSGRTQPWRRRGRAVLRELHQLISLEKRGGKPYDLREDTLAQVEGKLAEVRTLLKAEGNKQGVRLSFCLEEVVWESKAALAKYHSTRGEHKERNSKPRGNGKGAGRGGVEQGGAGAAAAVQAEEVGEEEEEEEEEEEAEGEDQGEDQGEGRAGTLCGKRRSDGPEAGSASKRR